MNGILELQLKDITASKFNPRKSFNDEKMAELVASIKEKGVIIPIIVRKITGKADKQITKDGLFALDLKIDEFLDKAIRQFNGHHKRIDSTLIELIKV